MMIQKLLCRAKWRWFHPTAFAKFDELMMNEHRSLDELMAWQVMTKELSAVLAEKGWML